MSIGLNAMQNTYQKYGMYGPGSSSWYPGQPSVTQGQSAGMGTGPIASLQTPSALMGAGAGVNAKANVPRVNQIQMPSWLSGDANSQIGELTGAYAGIGAAFNPAGIARAANENIAMNSAQGGQAANNAATEYSNRAAQSGASGLGAGVVKAQSLMPVLSQNAQIKTQAANDIAKTHQDAISLASQIAGTIGQLRTSYLNTLTGYAQGQQGLALDQYKAEQGVAGQAAQTQLGYSQLGQQGQLANAQLAADYYKTNLSAKQSQNDQARLAAQALLGAPGPSGNYTQDAVSGQVTSGQDTYNQLKNWKAGKTSAQNALMGMI